MRPWRASNSSSRHPAGPHVRVRMVIAYDGAPFHGFAANPGVATVAGALTDALANVLRTPVEVIGAGRTDAGVHAWGQVVSFDAPDGTDLARLVRAVNGQCAPALVARSAAAAPHDFDARFSAQSRCYRYHVLNTPTPSPFLAATSWYVPSPLDVAAMRNAAIPLVGEHDFSTFCKRPKTDHDVSLVRRLLRADWSAGNDGLLTFEIEAQSFCHNMVRSIVGTLIDVGLGRRTAASVAAALAARDRAQCGPVAPPHGLVLWEVRY